MKVLFITNLPSPYRVDFFNELGKYCELTVCYERHSATDRNSLWKGKSAVNFNEIYAKVKPVGVEQSRGNGIVSIIKTEKFDKLIIAGYASNSVMRAIIYCRIHRIPYYIESDGAFFVKDKFPKVFIKKFLLRGASLHFTTCDEHVEYLKWLGVDKEKICKYPFSSLTNADMQSTVVLTAAEKRAVREKLGMTEDRIILSVGRFSYKNGYRKGYDILLKAVKDIQSIGVYIVGEKPTEEFVRMKEEMQADHVRFVGFKNKKELQDYYAAADIFVLLTRYDIWGLVINEAMMHGLPVITTKKCNAGLEMVKNDENGFLVDVADYKSVRDLLPELLNDAELLEKFSKKSREIAELYTIENMAKVHIDVLNKN